MNNLPNLSKKTDEYAASQLCGEESVEEGEIREDRFIYVEDWDAPIGKRRVRVNSKENVSKTFNKSVKNDSSDPKVINIDKYINDRVSQILKEKITNESHNNILNEKIKIEILNKDSGVTRTYKLNTNTKFEIIEDFFNQSSKPKNWTMC